MKALKLFIGFILFSLVSIGQTPTGPLPVKTWFEYQKFNVKTSFVPPRDTLSTADSGAIATKGNTVYVKNGKWRPVADTNAVIGSDTFYLTHIGTSASQINTIYGVHGGIRASRWGDGLYTHVHLAADSLAFTDADTNFLATHAWVIAQYGVGTGVGGGNTIYTGDGYFTGVRTVSGRFNGQLNFDSMSFFNITSRHTQLQASNGIGGFSVDSALIEADLLGNNFSYLKISADSVWLASWNLGTSATDSAGISITPAGIRFQNYGRGLRTSYAAGKGLTKYLLAVDGDGNLIEATGLGEFSQQLSLTSGVAIVTMPGVTGNSLAFVQLVDQNGASNTHAVSADCTTNTVTVKALTSAGNNTVNTSDISTYNIYVFP